MSLPAPTKPVYLKACGIATSLGLTAEETAAAVRAGVSSYAESSVYNKQSNPMIMSLVPEDLLPPLDKKIEKTLPRLTSKQSRIVKLANLALDDLANKHQKLAGIPLLLTSSEIIPGLDNSCHPQLLQFISQQTSIEFHQSHSTIIAGGRAGALSSLHNAMAYMEAGHSTLTIVGGVDTYLDLRLLSNLDEDERILADSIMDAFVPGEGAGFILLSSTPVNFQDSGKQILIYPPGISVEPGHRYSDQPYKGDGLAQAFNLAISNTNLPQIKTVCSSLNGENFSAKELGVATTRNNKQIDPDYTIFHPADCFGDIGAAHFPVSTGLIAIGLLNNYLDGPSINYASSETDYRGAACISIN